MDNDKKFKRSSGRFGVFGGGRWRQDREMKIMTYFSVVFKLPCDIQVQVSRRHLDVYDTGGMLG